MGEKIGSLTRITGKKIVLQFSFFCESNIEDQENELLKMNRLISQYFHQAWLEVTRIAKTMEIDQL